MKILSFIGRITGMFCLIASLTVTSSSTYAQSIQEGESLFKRHCVSCHGLNQALVGPALKGTTTRHEQEWLYSWIRNSQAMIAAGDEMAVKLYEENDKRVMTAFPMLSDEEIGNILAYVEADAPVAIGATGTNQEGNSEDSANTGNLMLIGLLVVLGIALLAILALSRVIAMLNKIITYNATEAKTPLIGFKLVGLKLAHFTTNENDQAAIDCGKHWQKFETENYVQRIPGRLGDEIYAVYYDYQGDHTQPYRYFIGYRVSEETIVPDGLDSLTIPSGCYTKITAKGKMPYCVANAWRRIWKSEIDRIFSYDFEVYDQRSTNWSEAEVDIYLSSPKT